MLDNAKGQHVPHALFCVKSINAHGFGIIHVDNKDYMAYHTFKTLLEFCFPDLEFSDHIWPQ